MPSDRLRKINELLRTELAVEFSRQLEFPSDTVVSITKVTVSSDLHYATVYLSIVPESKSGTVLKLIRKQLSHILEALHQRVILRVTPRYQFKIDATEQRAAHIEALLDSLKETD